MDYHSSLYGAGWFQSGLDWNPDGCKTGLDRSQSVRTALKRAEGFKSVLNIYINTMPAHTQCSAPHKKAGEEEEVQSQISRTDMQAGHYSSLLAVPMSDDCHSWESSKELLTAPKTATMQYKVFYS